MSIEILSMVRAQGVGRREIEFKINAKYL